MLIQAIRQTSIFVCVFCSQNISRAKVQIKMVICSDRIIKMSCVSEANLLNNSSPNQLPTN